MKRELLNEETIVFENPDYDNAIIGETSDGRAVYEFDKMVGCLMDEDGMSEDESIDFIYYNTIRALDYINSATNGKAPIVMFPLMEV